MEDGERLMLRGTWVLRLLGVGALCAVMLAACGSNQPTTIPVPKGTKPHHLNLHTVYIYSSLPEHGPDQSASQQVVAGIRLFLHPRQYHVGSYKIKYRHLNDATARGWDPTRTVDNAERAARNPNTVAYIGEFDSRATELSLPILNQAGVVQITPGSGYPGLTSSILGVTLQGEPSKFRPQNGPTLLRLIPSETVEAGAILQVLQGQCQKVGVASFGGGLDGGAVYRAVIKTATNYGMTVVPPSPGSDVKTYAAYAATLSGAGVGCFVLTGHVTPAAVRLTEDINADLPNAQIVGSSGFCNRKWTDAARHGVPPYVDQRLLCTSPVQPLSPHYGQGGQRFAAEYKRRYGQKPGPYAIYGYWAAEMVYSAMNGLSGTGDNRKQVLDALTCACEGNSTVLGTYQFGVNGDLASPGDYGLYHIVNGVPDYWKAVTPRSVLTS